MKRVGVVVEGPSDLVFWSRFLGRKFSSRHGYWFDVRSMKGGSRVIQESTDLTDDFRKARYHSAFFILDADKRPCATAVLEQFDRAIRGEIRQQPPANRFANVFVALREIESWLLADEVCIQKLFELPGYRAVQAESPLIGGKTQLLKLCRNQGVFPAGMEDRECARQAAGLFEPERAARLSPSCAYFWERLNNRLQTSPA
jgi:hypothetical protein